MNPTDAAALRDQIAALKIGGDDITDSTLPWNQALDRAIATLQDPRDQIAALKIATLPAHADEESDQHWNSALDRALSLIDERTVRR